MLVFGLGRGWQAVASLGPSVQPSPRTTTTAADASTVRFALGRDHGYALDMRPAAMGMDGVGDGDGLFVIVQRAVMVALIVFHVVAF